MLIQGYPVYCAGGLVPIAKGHKGFTLPQLCLECELCCRPLDIISHNIKPSWRIKDRTILYNHETRTCPLFKKKDE